MSAASDVLEDALLNLILNQVAYPFAGAAYLALYTSDPGEDDSGTEVSGNGYARVAVSNGWTITGGGAGTATNTADINFGVATGVWGTVTHVAIHDAITGGDMLLKGSLSASIAPVANQIVKIDAGAATVSVA